MADQNSTNPPANDPATPPATPATTPTPPAPPATEPEQAVPYTRFKEVNDQLKALKAQIAALNGEKAQEAQTKTTLEQRLAALEGDLNRERAEKQRLKIATDKKLPVELASRLIGETEEELAADADRLLALLKPATPTSPGVPPSGGGQRRATLDLNSMTPAEIRKARQEGKI